MATETVEVLSDHVNNVVVKQRGRAFPGVIIQGDSLYILYSNIEDIRREILAGDQEEALAIVDDVLGLLLGRLTIYEEALARNGFSIPYNRKPR